jgi:murein DD-endopeptidase MepM/ murein hydrolase activator NlpD
MVEEDGRLWMRDYKNSGQENSDWYGYGADVLAPCDCTVANIRTNPDENLPGQLGKPPASSITFERPDKTLILLAHVKDIQVSVGDQVEAGDVVASVGNNGYSRQPHVHIGAWRGEVALQIRFDQKRMNSQTK